MIPSKSNNIDSDDLYNHASEIARMIPRNISENEDPDIVNSSGNDDTSSGSSSSRSSSSSATVTSNDILSMDELMNDSNSNSNHNDDDDSNDNEEDHSEFASTENYESDITDLTTSGISAEGMYSLDGILGNSLDGSGNHLDMSEDEDDDDVLFFGTPVKHTLQRKLSSSGNNTTIHNNTTTNNNNNSNTLDKDTNNEDDDDAKYDADEDIHQKPRKLMTMSLDPPPAMTTTTSAHKAPRTKVIITNSLHNRTSSHDDDHSEGFASICSSEMIRNIANQSAQMLSIKTFGGNVIVSSLIVIVGVVASAIFISIGFNASKQHQYDQFNKQSSNLIFEVLNAFQQYEVAGLFVQQHCRRVKSSIMDVHEDHDNYHNHTISSSQKVRLEFHELYYHLLSTGLEFQAMQCTPNITHQERPYYEQEARTYYNKYYPSYNYTGIRGFEGPDNNTLQYRSNASYYFPLHYVEPVRGNEAAIDLDLYSSVPRFAPIEQSFRTYQPSLSSRLQLVQETDPSAYSVILLHPGIPLLPKQITEDNIRIEAAEMELAKQQQNEHPRDIVSNLVIRIPALLKLAMASSSKLSSKLVSGSISTTKTTTTTRTPVSSVQQQLSTPLSQGLQVYIFDTTKSEKDDGIFLGAAKCCKDVTTSNTNNSPSNQLEFLKEVELSVVKKTQESSSPSALRGARRNNYALYQEEQVLIASSIWTIIVVPSDSSIYYKPINITFLIFCGVVIIASCIMLAVYVYKNNQNKILKIQKIQQESQAERAIVEALYPSNVRDRILSLQQEQNEQELMELKKQQKEIEHSQRRTKLRMKQKRRRREKRARQQKKQKQLQNSNNQSTAPDDDEEDDDDNEEDGQRRMWNTSISTSSRSGLSTLGNHSSRRGGNKNKNNKSKDSKLRKCVARMKSKSEVHDGDDNGDDDEANKNSNGSPEHEKQKKRDSSNSMESSISLISGFSGLSSGGVANVMNCNSNHSQHSRSHNRSGHNRSSHNRSSHNRSNHIRKGNPNEDDERTTNMKDVFNDKLFFGLGGSGNGATSNSVSGSVLNRLRNNKSSHDRQHTMMNGHSSHSRHSRHSRHSNHQRTQPIIADYFNETTIMFADLVNFTKWSANNEPEQIFTLLEALYCTFDDIAKRLGVFKVETIGDCYVAACGVPSENEFHATIMTLFANECLNKFPIILEELHESSIFMTNHSNDTCPTTGTCSTVHNHNKNDSARASPQESSGRKNKNHYENGTNDNCGESKKDNLTKKTHSDAAAAASPTATATATTTNDNAIPQLRDLNIRIGLHSGPVVAGVLRGQKGRFQLFGDTMNTTSRVETTGKPGKIHISNSTANYLSSDNKGHWYYKRTDAVFAKGKGKLDTFWILPSAVNNDTGSQYAGDTKLDSPVHDNHDQIM